MLKYIYATLYLYTPVYFYKKNLDQPNITYMIQKIKKIFFQEFDILLPNGEAVAVASIQNILKTMIFVDKINESILITKYFQSLFLQHMSHQKNEII